MNDVNIDDLYELSHTLDENIEEYPLTGTSDEVVGWTVATIDSFDVDNSDNDLYMHIRFDWGETHIYTYDLDGLFSGKFKDLCNSYGINVKQFERLVGEDVWIKVRNPKIEDGDIKTNGWLNRYVASGGPIQFYKIKAMLLLKSFIVLAVLVLVVGVVL